MKLREIPYPNPEKYEVLRVEIKVESLSRPLYVKADKF